MKQQFIFTILPLITLLTTIFINRKDSKDSFFQAYLLLTILTEIIALMVGHFTLQRPVIVYNIYVPFGFAILCFMFNKIIVTPKIKKLKFVFIGFVFLTSIVSMCFNNIFVEYLKAPYYFSSSLLLFFVFTYLKEIMNSDKILDISNLRYFWISMGLLLFYVPFIPLFFYVDYLTRYDIYFILILVLNIIMHICYTFGYIWTRKVK